MGTCICACGAKYRFADKASGKKAKCKRCGEALTLGSTLSLPSKDFGAGPGTPSPSSPSHIPAPIYEVEYEDDEPQQPWHSRPERGYWNALFWTFLFPSSIHNLATFLTLWAFYGFIDCLPIGRFSIIFVVFFFTIGLWYVAFRVEVVEGAASGQFRLPDVDVSSDLWSEFLDPAIRWYGSWLVVFLPAFIYSTIQGFRGINVISQTWQAIVNPPLLGVPGPVVDPILMMLVIVGLFFWPMVALVAIIGGFGTLWRLDLVLFTFGNSVVPYFVTVLVVALSYAVLLVSEAYLSPPLMSVYQSSTFQALGTGILLRILAEGIEIYLAIVSARAIGLYFRHFGHRFAWDWGQQD